MRRDFIGKFRRVLPDGKVQHHHEPCTVFVGELPSTLRKKQGRPASSAQVDAMRSTTSRRAMRNLVRRRHRRRHRRYGQLMCKACRAERRDIPCAATQRPALATTTVAPRS